MFFRKKQKVDLDAKFKEVYREVNKITADAGNELDVTIKYSQCGIRKRNTLFLQSNFIAALAVMN